MRFTDFQDEPVRDFEDQVIRVVLGGDVERSADMLFGLRQRDDVRHDSPPFFASFPSSPRRSMSCQSDESPGRANVSTLAIQMFPLWRTSAAAGYCFEYRQTPANHGVRTRQ